MGGGMGAFWGTRVMELVKKHDSGGLLWKRIKLTPTRKANAKTRLRRVWQNEAVLRACGESDAPNSSGASNTKSCSSAVKNE
ncbi:Ribosomal protein L31 mitochondrial [Arabidopsis thaliana x Arabidopsis arenosa]|uniref:Ribosomal protein L31 mitochondrial n=1 Tax=Arabidopsis thaliana x Arabidopsis arenosa TaxID=1240361 RepID=A0A8T2CCN5_9BRAS|nr:Ribosomal protein L31 mitochondrial [Arabidopsis thaliana x Arabidopsis arenosa]